MILNCDQHGKMSPEDLANISGGLSFENFNYLGRNSENMKEFMAIPGNRERYDNCMKAHNLRSIRSDNTFSLVIGILGIVILAFSISILNTNGVSLFTLIGTGIAIGSLLVCLVLSAGKPHHLLKPRGYIIER